MNEIASQIKNQDIIYSNVGYISYRYESNIYFKIAKLTFERFENEEFQYIFEPFYDVLDAFNNISIPGIDLSLRMKYYYRANVTPVFISERVIPENRVNLQEELRKLGLTYYNAFEILLDSNKKYSGDNLYLKSDHFYSKNETKFDKLDIYRTTISILKLLGGRNEFLIGDLCVDISNRTMLIKNYLYLLKKTQKYYFEKGLNGRGRKKIDVSFVVLKEIRDLYSNGLIDIDVAVKRSGLKSKSTFFRRLKELNNQELDTNSD